MLSLFRMMNILSGAIFIDDEDIAAMRALHTTLIRRIFFHKFYLALYKLRRALTIVPQDPIMFAGTVRSNLDPMREHTDSELWGVLEKVYYSLIGY